MAVKLNTKKRKVMNFDEIKAYKVAYGGQLSTKDLTTYVGAPALLLALFSFLLLYHGWVTIGFFIIGAIYGRVTVLPKVTMKRYEAEAFNQRNKFLNNLTQVLTDDKQTVLMALHKVTPRADGEFREDLKRFHAMLVGADNSQIRDAIVWFSEEYEDDVIFVQYLEQIETSLIEGKTNVDTLKDIKTYHNDISMKQSKYEMVKKGHLRDMRQLIIIMAIFIIALGVSFGFETYFNAFARHIVGYIASGLYMGLMMIFFNQFTGYYFDDSVLEIRS